MAHDMKDNGRTTFNMDKARKLGLMDRYMKDNTMQGKNMDLVYTVGMMGADTKVTGKKTKLMLKVN
jgi:hypothetical protein